MTASELVETIKQRGGVLALDGDGVEYVLPSDTSHLLGMLRQHKEELIAILRVHGGRIGSFPHCPRCASYALYRRDTLNDFQCETCGLQNIEETVARRTQ